MTMDVTPSQSPLSPRVAEEIRSWMGRRRMSGAQLARMLGVSPAWISYRLTGTQPIDLNDLQRIAEALSVEVIELIPAREGRTVAVSGTARPARRESKPCNPSLPKRPGPSGPPSRNTPVPSGGRTARVHPAVHPIIAHAV